MSVHTLMLQQLMNVFNKECQADCLVHRLLLLMQQKKHRILIKTRLQCLQRALYIHVVMKITQDCRLETKSMPSLRTQNLHDCRATPVLCIQEINQQFLPVLCLLLRLQIVLQKLMLEVMFHWQRIVKYLIWTLNIIYPSLYLRQEVLL